MQLALKDTLERTLLMDTLHGILLACWSKEGLQPLGSPFEIRFRTTQVQS
jgi:hypothetical protein